jgi:hypothetical protein
MFAAVDGVRLCWMSLAQTSLSPDSKNQRLFAAEAN